MVIEMANVVPFQPFTSFKIQYRERWSCEALREKEELHVKLKSVTNTQWIPWIVFNQSKCSILVNKFLINLREQRDWTQKFSSLQPRLVIEQQSIIDIESTVARSCSFTSKFMKAIMPVVEKDAKAFMEKLKESSMVIHFSVNNL